MERSPPVFGSLGPAQPVASIDPTVLAPNAVEVIIGLHGKMRPNLRCAFIGKLKSAVVAFTEGGSISFGLCNSGSGVWHHGVSLLFDYWEEELSIGNVRPVTEFIVEESGPKLGFQAAQINAANVFAEVC